MNFLIVKQPKIIEHIQRKDIFEHNYNVNDLFKQFYKDSPAELDKVKPKRPPNSFMIFRAILGLVANYKSIKIKDGPEQSKLAAFFWKGANENEKSKFRELCSEFKKLHLQLFPNFKIQNKRAKRRFLVKSIKTAESYQKGGLPVSSDYYLNKQSPYNVHDNYQSYSYKFHSMFHSTYKHVPKFEYLSVNIPF